MKAAITGATGVVGGAVLRHLVDKNIDVRALMRPGRKLDGLSEPGIVESARVESMPVEIVLGDILEPESLVDAFSGADVVYHVAGINQMCVADPSSMYRVNVEGTRNVLRAARSAGVARIVYTSSAATIGEAQGEVGNEDTMHRGYFMSHYERSKYEAEQVVAAEAADLDVVVVNPSSVQGPGRSTGTGKLLLDLVAGKVSTLIDTRVSIVDINDCARGHQLAAEKGTGGRRYVLNSVSMTTQEAVALVEQVTGRDLPVRYMPAWLAAGAGIVIGGAYKVVGRKAPICSELVKTLIHGHVYDGSRATRELGLIYTAASETLVRLIEWARGQQILP